MFKKIYSFLILIGIAGVAYGGLIYNPQITSKFDMIQTIEEEDGILSVPAAIIIKVPNTSLTDNADGTASLDFGVMTETDPIASAVNGILKSDGTTLSAASAVDLPITDSGSIITATEVEGALQENRTAIDLNTAADLDTVSDRGATTDQALTTGGIVVGDGDTVGSATYKFTFDETNGAISAAGKIYQTGLGDSTFFGYEAGKVDDASANFNTAFGYQALVTNTTGYYNTALGYLTLADNLGGYSNTAVGLQALLNNTSGANNTGIGFLALPYSLASNNNVALGAYAGATDDAAANVTGASGCVIIGASADFDTTTPVNEIVIGATANGNGDNSVTLGNDSITKTVLKGNVGIGTTSPDVNLDVEGSTGISIGENKAGGTSNDEGVVRWWSDGDNDYYTTIKTGVQTQSITYTLPLDDGDAGQVMTTDGSGVMDWTAAGSGDALVANPLSQFAATTSAELAGVLSDESGSGLVVYNDSPTLITPALGTPSALVGTNISGTGSSFTAGAVSTITGLAPDTQNTYSRTQYLIPYASTTTAFGQIAIGTDGQVLTSGGAGVAPSFETLSIAAGEYAANSIDDDDIDNTADVMSGSFGITIDGGGSEITTGIKGYIEIPYAMTIDRATVLLDQSGSIVIDVWLEQYVDYPPTDADSITSSTPPTVTTATKSEDTTLTSWTTSVTAGDIIGFNIDSCTTATRAHLIISGNKL